MVLAVLLYCGLADCDICCVFRLLLGRYFCVYINYAENHPIHFLYFGILFTAPEKSSLDCTFWNDFCAIG